MSWCDWTNEDFDFDEDRYEDDPYRSKHPFGAEYEATFARNKVARTCVKCDHNFKSAYPCACPECGGWTEAKVDFTSV